MSEDNVVQMPGRGALDSPTFQTALKLWRKFAHRRGLVVGSPVRLIGAERTIFGDSDDMVEGAKSYVLNKTGIGIDLGGLWVSKSDKEMLEQLVEDLDARSDFDIKDVRAPSTEQVPDHDDERGRWDLWLSPTQRVGTVVRVGEGSQKHYLLYLWHGGWYRVTGQPCYDLPLFGLPDLRARPESPVMIHEGPKSWEGAIAASGADKSRLANWLSLYVHVGWHGSDIGMEWTDWSPLRGRKVLIWPDMDEAGLANARLLATRLSQMDMVVEYVTWSADDIKGAEGWDWGDWLKPPAVIKAMTRSDVRKRVQMVESPVGPDGRLLDGWLRRSFYDMARKEIYQVSTDFKPVPLDSVALAHGKNFRSDVAKSSINRFRGVDFRPGKEHGRMDDGKINLCPPNIREPVAPIPLGKDLYKRLRNGWLKKMVPDVQQRKHLIRRACWAIARPEQPSQHMIVLQGESGIGKSVLLDLIVRIAGTDRAVSIFPDAALGKFNNLIMHKSLIAIHEVHSDELTRKQNASRLKELVANDSITFEEKGRPKVTMTNVIHWFAATNERIPFSLEGGNDRFYFVRCASPRTQKAADVRKRFFETWVPKFKKEEFLDRLYAAAKYQVTTFTKKTVSLMTGRAPRQFVWKHMEARSRPIWAQNLLTELSEAREKFPDTCFNGSAIARRIVEQGRFRISQNMVFDELRIDGFYPLTTTTGNKVRVIKDGVRVTPWCHKSEFKKMRELARLGRLEVMADDFTDAVVASAVKVQKS